MKKIKNLIIGAVLSMAIFSSSAQNLVPNPSFEYYSSCPTGSSQISLAVPWMGVSTNSSDYFNLCGSGGTSVPAGGGGFQYAKTGVAYAGIWAINGYGSNYREYIQVQSDSILQTDSCYFVEFYCNLLNASRYGVNKMGLHLSNTAVSVVGPGLVLQYSPQILSSSSLTDTVNWIRISGYYQATGGEQYITIGNFSSDFDTDTIHVGGSNYNGSYYLIEDVSIIKVTGCDTTATTIHESKNNPVFNIYPNPSTGNIILEYYNHRISDIVFIEIYDIIGKIIMKKTLGVNCTSLQLNEHLENGIYFYHFVVNNRIVKSDRLLIIK